MMRCSDAESEASSSSRHRKTDLGNVFQRSPLDASQTRTVRSEAVVMVLLMAE